MGQRKVAFITGSGKKRIGNAVALEAARRGYEVGIHYNTSKIEAEATLEEIRALGVRAEAFQADLAKEAETLSMLDDVAQTFGRVDLLVNCASIWPQKPFFETSVADINESFAVNTVATFLCAQKLGALMVAQAEGGSIVCVGDWAVVRPYNNYSAYFVSKGAIPTMTITLANELARLNPKVRVNCIHPGPAMVPGSVTAYEKEKVTQHSLVERLGTPENVAQAVFALTDNDFVTGVCLPVDGGRSVSNKL